MSSAECGGGWCHAYHNYQRCRSYETPDEVGVQAKPATAEEEILGKDGEWCLGEEVAI